VKRDPHTALVVDDDPMIRRLIVVLLATRGFRTLGAQNGLEAVQVFGSYHAGIALVVTDVEMPVMDGLEAVGRMFEIDRAVPILIISGRAAELIERRPDCRWLEKPFTPAQFLDSVRLALAEPSQP
jgi:CheY-like chemotaxis protein